MTERDMQFRIGIFVIVAGLVLATMIVWFGESPALFRKQEYITVQYEEAPGVNEGIPVRKSGIRVGEVTAIGFDERPDHPDGILVTIAIDKKMRDKIKSKPVPRISRGLMGDVTIELVPGHTNEPFKTSSDPANAPVIAGEVATDPSKALEAAATAFEKAGDTFKSIDKAALGIAAVAKKAEGVDELLSTYREAGSNLNRLITDNEPNLKPAIDNIRQVSEKLNTTLDEKTMANFQASAQRLATATDRLDSVLANFKPVSEDLAAPPNVRAVTKFGQTIEQFYGLLYDVRSVTRIDPRRPNSGLQGLPIAVDNINQTAISARTVFDGAKPVMRNLQEFSARIKGDPGLLFKDAIRRP